MWQIQDYEVDGSFHFMEYISAPYKSVWQSHDYEAHETIPLYGLYKCPLLECVADS